MKKILFALLLLVGASSFAGVTLRPIIVYEDSKYLKVPANNVDTSGGDVIPDGQKIGIYRIIANGADPVAYVSIVYCYADATDEKIFRSTKGDINLILDISLASNQVTGNGVCKLKIIITNDDADQTPIIGGSYEAIEL